MDKVIFAFGQNGCFYYQSATHSAEKVPGAVSNEPTATAYSGPGINCVAPGCSVDSFFMNVGGNFQFKNLPPSLESWLHRSEGSGPSTSCTAKVALGPDNSFFAWDKTSMRWGNLPPRLEEKLQSWVGPDGWRHGSPSIVTLGYGGSFYIGTTDGSYAYHVPPQQTEMRRKWDYMDIECGEFQYVSFNPFRKNEFVAIRSSGKYDYIVPDPLGCFLDVADSISDPERVKVRIADRQKLAEAEREQKARKMREEEAEQKQRTERGADQERTERARKKKAEEEAREKQAEDEPRKKDAEEEARRRQAKEDSRKQKPEEEARKTKAKKEAENREREQTFRQQQYTRWKTICDECFSTDAPMTTFPHVPILMCTCTDISCISRKIEGSLMACRHDMERLLRGSGQYSYSWLKTESYPWHPDRFGRKCHPDFKEQLTRKATEMFAVFGELLEEARC